MEVSLIENFLSIQECIDLIDFAKPQLSDSTVVSNINKEERRSVEYGHRNSQDLYVKNPTELIDNIKLRIQETIGIPVNTMEDLCIIYYKVGGYFKPHNDFFHPNTPNYLDCIKNGGNRKLTCLMYLHSPEIGGETNFPQLGKQFSPNPGTILYWNNMIRNGVLLYDSLHEGLPIIKGEKWIATIWCRENEFKK